MEQEPILKPKSDMSRTLWAYFAVAVTLSAIITGGLVHVVQSKQNADAQNTLRAQIDSLKSQLSVLPTATPIATATPGAPATVTASPSASPTTAASPKTTTYTNTKYGYSFSYPDATTLTASAGDNDSLPINATADGVNAFPVKGNVGNGTFYVNVSTTDLTPTGIKGLFTTTPADKIAITAVTIGGVSGYKVTLPTNQSVTSTFYFVKNAAGSVLELTVPNDNATAQAIFDSFRITK